MRPLKIERWSVVVVICLERGADCLHMVQLMSLPSHHLLPHLNPLAAQPLDTRPCISRFALGPGFVCRKVTTLAMLTQRSCCLLQRLSAAGPSLGSELAGTLLCGL